MKKTLLILGLVLVILAGGMYVQRRRILVAVGSFLVSRDPLIHADGIAILSGKIPSRILEGIALYRRGLTEVVCGYAHQVHVDIPAIPQS